MNRPNRDLLVLFKQELMNPQAMEHEVELLHDMLYAVERSQAVLSAHEIIDLNKYKIISQPLQLKAYFRNKTEKPFVFINNKN